VSLRATSPALYEKFYLELTQAYTLIQRQIATVLQRHGLTLAEHALLRVVEHHPGITAAEIARRLSMTPPAITQMLNTCARKKFVVRSADQQDARRSALQLTPAGRMAVKQARKSLDDFLADTAVSKQLFASLTGQLMEFTATFSPNV
jgi:DNA-binding MarR family transcriptional regulator